MGDKSWRFGKEELQYVKEVLDSGPGAGPRRMRAGVHAS